MSALDDAIEQARKRLSPGLAERIHNRLESHLGCVVCRGRLDANGRCPACDPEAAMSDHTEGTEAPGGYEPCSITPTMDMAGHVTECRGCGGSGWRRKRDPRGRFVR